MPVTIQLTGLKYKNSQGQFQSADCLKGEDADISIIAPDYSELTFPVNAGKLCTHDLKLYRAKQGIPTSENWTESHWDERTIEEELAAKYTKPAGGIPASDLADGVIPDIIDDEAGAGDTDVTFSADKLTTDLFSLSNALNQSTAATNSDIGKAHSPKTVVDGKVTEWQYVPVGGGGGTVDDELSSTSVNPVQNKVITEVVTVETGETETDITSELEAGGYYKTNGGIGTTVSTTRYSYNDAKSNYWSASAGDKFVITGRGGDGARLWCLTDASFKILSVSESNASATNLELDVLADGYLFVNVYTSYDTSVKKIGSTRSTVGEVVIELLDDVEELSEQVADISETVSDMNSYEGGAGWEDLSGLFVNNTAYNTGGPGVGGTVATPASYNSTAASLMYSVSNGDKFNLSGHGGGNSRLWCFTDTDKKILSVSDANITQSNLELVASADGYLFVNVYMSDPHSLSIKQNGGSITLKQKINQIDAAIFGRFDWETLAGKKIAVLGDSISTNGDDGTDHNVYEIEVQTEDVGVELSAYLTYYDVQGGLSLGGHTFTSEEIGTEVTFTPVAGDVGKKIGKPNNYNSNNTTVWWEVMQEKFGNNTIPVCWSGSSITSHEANSDPFKTAHAWHDAQIRKCGIRTPGTMTRVAPDMIIIYRGTNDFSHSPYTKLTEGYFDSSNWQYPADDTVTGGYGYLEGISLTIKKLREAYPEAQIYLCTMNVFKRVNSSHFPSNNGLNTLPEYNNAIREAANFFGCGIIEFDKDGITFENMYSGGYITEGNQTHPTNKGHAVMGRKAVADIMAQFNVLDDGT